MKYKVGDKVKIKKREELKECYIVVEAMLSYADTIATIAYVDDWNEFYNIDVDKDDFRWIDECFAELTDKELTDISIINIKNEIVKKAEQIENLQEKVNCLKIEIEGLISQMYQLERIENEINYKKTSKLN